MPTLKTWFNLDTMQQMTGTEREYWCYKIEQLLKRKDLLNEEYFDDALTRSLEACCDAFNREMGYEVK